MIRALLITILVLALACAGTGWMLKKSWEKNATLKGNISQYEETVKGLQEELDTAYLSAELTEITLSDNAARKEIVVETKERIKYVVRETAERSPAESCLNQPVPDVILDCLRGGECSNPQ